ncbi:MAG: methionine gamma-lyase family protein [Clostridia bacterium]|nr:methionine gamma-lyase family protein [Clostridia bacterium]
MNYYEKLGISSETVELFSEAKAAAATAFSKIDETASYNAAKVLSAFKNNGVSEAHFAPSTGYGYDDLGRDTLEKIYAEIFSCGDSLVRHTITCGTHALALCMYGVLRPGDTLLCVTGKPYDTLEESIMGEGVGSLKEFGIGYACVDLKADGTPDFNAISESVTDSVKAVWIQKSKGYEWRNSLSNEVIGEIVSCVKAKKPDCICIVDNCYGEFVEKTEPTEVGADLCAGSLIKNLGGGIVKSGGYVAGREDLVEKASYRLTAPGIGKHVGASMGHTRDMYYGLFTAPHIVAQCLKTAVLCSTVLEKLGYEVHPKPNDERYCIIQAAKFLSPEKLVAFIQGIQMGSPVDASFLPQPAPMPGYKHKVIMAAGTFVSGSTCELSADAPIKEPYVGYVQGGINVESAELGLMLAVENLKKI